jgi:hypothetical protein
LVRNGLPVGPAGRQHAAAEIDEVCLRNLDAERADRVAFGGGRRTRGKKAGASGGKSHRGGGEDRRLCRSTISEPDRAGIANLLKASPTQIVTVHELLYFCDPGLENQLPKPAEAMLPVKAG